MNQQNTENILNYMHCAHYKSKFIAKQDWNSFSFKSVPEGTLGRKLRGRRNRDVFSLRSNNEQSCPSKTRDDAV